MKSRRIHWQWLFILGLVLLPWLFFSPHSFASSYDSYFERYGSKYLPVYDWRWLKAQGLTESNLDKDAVSSAGAQGIMQIMPLTWLEETERLGIIASPFNARVNILVGASYMRRMVKFWKAPRTDMQRLELAQASYNAGAGNILKAQTLCKQWSMTTGQAWWEIRPCLHKITGHHAEETINYIERIKRWMKKLYMG